MGKDNALQHKDLGLVHSSAAIDLVTFIINRMRGDGDVEPGVSPTFLVRHWPAFTEWSTKAVRDAFFASPLFPRLLDAESVKETVARGVENSILAYVGKGKGAATSLSTSAAVSLPPKSRFPTRCSSSQPKRPRSMSNRRA